MESFVPTKINLLNRKKAQIKRRVSEGTVYVVRTNNNGTAYYVTDADKDTGAITWSKHQSKAMTFHTEAGVQHFVHNFMRKRTDIELVGIRSKHA